MFSNFIGRNKEISLLEDEWKKTDGRLIILYGRRRIGKTRLLLEFTAGKQGIFYIAEDASSHIQINRLREKIAEFTGDNVLRTLKMNNWDQLFGYFIRIFPHKRFYLVIDEFSCLIKSDKSILNTLNQYWDTEFPSSGIYMILSDSMPVMNQMTVPYESTLFGKRTRDIQLKELSFLDAKNFSIWNSQNFLKYI